MFKVIHTKMEEPYYEGDSFEEATDVFEKQKNYWRRHANVQVTEVSKLHLNEKRLRAIRLEHGPSIELIRE